MSEKLIQNLQNPDLYDHPVDQFQVMETHISWVILTGPYAYKIKKPMNFGFLNFTTLEQRRHFCNEELRLNQRLAAELYDTVIPITGSEDQPAFDGDGSAFEYALRVKQFDNDLLLNKLAAAGQLNTDHIDTIAAIVADFHSQATAAGADVTLGDPADVMAPAQQNFDQIRPLITEQDDLMQLDQLEGWAQDTYARLQPLLAERKAQGFIRECHGDLHLGNITQHDGKIVPFDCIEFNDEFRWIDVINEVAFLSMDLEDRGLTHMAHRFINTYIEHTGDFAGLKLFNFYKAYRAMVRAKVALLGLGDNPSDEARIAAFNSYRGYANLAEHYMELPQRYLVLMHGYSGSGKTTVSNALLDNFSPFRLRSDVERKRLFAAEKSGDALYSAEVTAATFKHLAIEADHLLEAGFSVIVDATFLNQAHRDLFHRVAEHVGVPIQLISCQLDDAMIRERLTAREAEGTDASDATVAIYESQVANAEPLTEDESHHTIVVDTSSAEHIEGFIETVRERL